MNTASQIRLFLTLSPEEYGMLLSAYTAFVLKEGEHPSFNQWARKQLINKVKESRE